ncbi:deoxycytidylate deaminase [Sulfurimonas sp. NW7]|uniref:deoxycytidylate deaminase n=1 Tax=Sulfurimonas sp. NW7 TaxID=2922727 RepID=UPI003DA85E2C
MHNALKAIYNHRDKFIILGVTGKIGVGCTTTADFLTQDIDKHNLPKICLTPESDDSHRKKYIIDKFYHANWKPFIKITASDVIATFVFEKSFNDFNRFLLNKDLAELSDESKARYKKYKKLAKENLKKLKNRNYDDETYDFVVNKVPKISKWLKKKLTKEHYRDYTKVFQSIGDNIRKTGTYDGSGDHNAFNIYAISERINSFIKALRKYHGKEKETFVVIDAFRNPFEVMFFKERYSAFYLLSINAEQDYIHDRLFKNFEMTEEEIRTQNEKENPGDSLEDYDKFISQNIQECIQKSDIHISNNGKVSNSPNYHELYGQIIKYISLIQHPGLVTPSHDEKMMQIAYTAKLNSGCISRQVGAVVTNHQGSVKSIGWNNVADGQTACLLRNTDEILKGSTSLAYTPYEKSMEFKGALIKFSPLLPEAKLKGRNQSFCFKTVYNKFKGDKNQVHTRSLHAEENAFLQVAKYGGEGIQGGTLYSTASPCELCSKKAYQLGIERVVYIDPYPGIAQKQILLAGKIPPKLALFKGAIGSAYHRIYDPILAYKDELGALQEKNIYKNLCGKIVKIKRKTLKMKINTTDENDIQMIIDFEIHDLSKFRENYLTKNCVIKVLEKEKKLFISTENNINIMDR